MNPFRCHWARFQAVGAAGVVVQSAVLALLVCVARLDYLVATAMAVEAAVLHNFAWHRQWTWADRPGLEATRVWPMLLRFHLTTGALSITGNLVFMRLLVGEGGLHPMVANLVTIAACSLINFVVSDRVVFIPTCWKREI